jgi:signal transduction histidine kinase
MSRVSKGNFKINLETKNTIDEIQDIYENFNLMTRELDATEILQSDFISNVSHEIRTPINAIEGYATLLQSMDGVGEEQNEYIEKIIYNTRRLSGVVGNILLLSKLESSVIKPKESEFRIDEQIRMSLMGLEKKWDAKGLELDVEMEELIFLGNDGLFFHVWNNLIENAIKFSDDGSVIAIRLARKDEKIVFSIENQGPCIKEEDLLHIFDKFFQADTSRKQEGNGLGLSLVKRILDIYAGSITAENTEKGCKFTVTL